MIDATRWTEQYEREMHHALDGAAPAATVMVCVPWHDPEETPLDAIGRLNNEVLELQARCRP